MNHPAGTAAKPADVVVAEVVRSGFVESRHRGCVVVTSPAGDPSWSLGEVSAPMFPRSANKPIQALGMLRNGLDVDGELLALVSASHSGEPFHLDGVRAILRTAGLDEDALQTPPEHPLDEQSRERAIAAGQPRLPVAMNCSGKHAGMLVTCIANGWSLESYRDPRHPLQQRLRDVVAEVTAVEVSRAGVDGCGAPVFASSLAGLARAFGWFAAAEPATLPGRIADAVRAFPAYASGTSRDERALIEALPGLFCKAGAEAVYAAGLPDGRGIAVKITDGTPRAATVVMAAVLRRLGFEHPVLDTQQQAPVLGGGRRVGSVRPAAALLG